jgi:hypothetical protein
MASQAEVTKESERFGLLRENKLTPFGNAICTSEFINDNETIGVYGEIFKPTDPLKFSEYERLVLKLHNKYLIRVPHITQRGNYVVRQIVMDFKIYVKQNNLTI